MSSAGNPDPRDRDSTPKERLQEALKSPYKESDSTWEDVIDTISSVLVEYEKSVSNTFEGRDIESATGHTIDKYASRWLVERRTGESDAEFRARVKTQLRRELASGTLDQVKETSAILLRIERYEIDVVEPDDDPLSLVVEISADKLGKTEISPALWEKLLDDISAAGVSASHVAFAEKDFIRLSGGSSVSNTTDTEGMSLDQFDGDGSFSGGTSDTVEGTTAIPSLSVSIAVSSIDSSVAIEGFGESSFGAGTLDGTADVSDVSDSTSATQQSVLFLGGNTVVSSTSGLGASAFGAGAFDGTPDDQSVYSKSQLGDQAISVASQSVNTTEDDGFGSGTLDGSGQF